MVIANRQVPNDHDCLGAVAMTQVRQQVAQVGFCPRSAERDPDHLLLTRPSTRRISRPRPSLRVTTLGTLIALSSGGPEVNVHCVRQPAEFNRDVDFSGRPKQRSQLSWRELEYYAQAMPAGMQHTAAAGFLPRRAHRLHENPGRQGAHRPYERRSVDLSHYRQTRITFCEHSYRDARTFAEHLKLARPIKDEA